MVPTTSGEVGQLLKEGVPDWERIGFEVCRARC